MLLIGEMLMFMIIIPKITLTSYSQLALLSSRTIVPKHRAIVL